MTRKRRPDSIQKPATGGAANNSWRSANELPAWANTRRSLIYAALGLICSVIFFVQLLRADSMLGGIMGWELQKLSNDNKKPGQKTWNDLRAEFSQEAAKMPGFKEHQAANRLLIAVAYVHRGQIEAPRILETARLWLKDDPDNLVSRLAFAYLREKAQPGSGGSIQQRFENVRFVVESENPARTATLRQDAFNRKWHEIIMRHIKRADVAASVARHFAYEQSEPFVALPIIRAWLNEVREGLARDMKSGESEHCAEWTRKAMLGIIEQEPDAGIRLLAADLLARSLDSDLPLAKNLRRMRGDFHASADASPIDVFDILKSPALPLGNKSTALDTFLLTSSASAAAGIGAFFALVLIGLIAGMRKVLKIKHTDPFGFVSENARNLRFGPVYLPALLAAGIWTVSRYAGFVERGIVSTEIVAAAFLCWAMAGATGILAISLTVVRSHWVGKEFAVLQFAVFLLLPLLPAAYWLGPVRAIDLNIGLSNVLIPLPFLVLSIAFVSTSRLASLNAHIALRLFLWMMISALVIFQGTKVADWEKSEKITAGRWDEAFARLGPDWKAKYLGEPMTSPAPQP